MANLFYTPQYIIAGENALDMGKEYLKQFGKKALIVTDEMMVKLGNVEKLTDALDKVDVSYEIYPGINSEPDNKMIEVGAEIYKSNNCDFLIGLGGGSPIDSMKAIGVIVANGGKISDYVGKPIEKELPKMCAIPTTAGTGSEATRVTIITNLETQVKMLIMNDKMMSNLALVDPIFTLTAPKGVTSATGVDALTHAIEAYTSKKAFSMSDIYAVSAVKRIFKNILEAYENGTNIEARNEMAIASLEAGMAFSNSSVTIVHGMSRPIGALFHVPHGLSNAMLLPACLDFIKEGAVERYCELAKVIGVYEEGMSEREGADAFVTATKDLLSKLDIKTLAEFGVDKNEFFKHVSKMADDALASGSPQNTRHSPNKEDILELYNQLW